MSRESEQCADEPDPYALGTFPLMLSIRRVLLPTDVFLAPTVGRGMARLWIRPRLVPRAKDSSEPMY